MKKILLLLTFTVVLSIGLTAQLFCPEDITVSCLSDLTPDECGMATVVSGNYHPSMVKFIDQNETNACNEGTVFRRFYLDVDYSNTYTENEPSCIQTITLIYNNLPLNIQYPTDKEYSCLDEIPVESPTWLHNPCDLVGYTYEDEVFEFEEGACLKIVRRFHVINWCIYDEDPDEGLYTGIQIIKIVDKVAPEIEDCSDQSFDAGANCEAMVTLTNSATDSGDCPSGTLTWRVSVDLWADGTEDMFFGPNEPIPFRLNPVESGETVSIEIPEALSVSKHKVDWKVTDGCGNVRTCSNMFFVEDNKPPTPYCINFTGATLNGAEGWTLTIPVSLFSLDALDNCSAKEDITLSFSENLEDTERVLECGDAGLQFYRIYYTDEAGNQDFCEVFMIVFDNGSCSGRYAPEGIVTSPNGTPIQGANAYLMEGDEIISLIDSDEFGFFSFGEQALMESYNATVKSENEGDELVDIEDFMVMRSALLGLEQLDFYQKVAADIDGNAAFDIDDLYEFRNVLLGESSIAKSDLWTFIPQMENVNSQSNLEVSQSIPYNQYGEGFDFYGVRTGDLTGSKMSLDAESEEEDLISLTIEISEDEVAVIANHEFTTDGMQFEMITSSLEVEKISKYGVVNLIEDGFRYLDLHTSKEIAKDQELFKFKINTSDSFSIGDAIKKAKIFLHGSDNAANISYRVDDQRDKTESKVDFVELKVYPLPMQERLNIEGENITDLAMYNLTGERFQIETLIQKNGATITTGNNLPNGIYFLKVIADGEEKVVKVVK